MWQQLVIKSKKKIELPQKKYILVKMSRVDPEFTFMVYTLLCLEKKLLDKEETEKYQTAIDGGLKGTQTYDWLMCHANNYKLINPSNEHLITKHKYWETQCKHYVNQ
jgi:hypothetical protein